MINRIMQISRWQKGRRASSYLAILIVLAILPQLMSGYYVYILSYVGVFAIACISLNLLFGTAGLISIGHAGFLLIGAYTNGLLIVKAGVPFIVGVPVAGLLAAAGGLLLGVPALRMGGFYLAIVTIAFGIAMEKLAKLWDGLTFGSGGFYVPDPSIGGFTFDSDPKLYYLIFAVLALVVIGVVNISKSRTGRALRAVRDNEVAAQCMGIDLSRTKLLAFVLSAFIAGIAGALYAHLVGFVHPGTFPLWLSIMLLAAVILGGTNRVASGAIAGSAIIFGLPEFLRGAQELQMVGFGIAIILVILFAPTGFMGIVDSLRAKVIGLLRRRALSTEEL